MVIVNGTAGDDVIHGTETTGLSLNDGETDQYAEIANFNDMPTSALTIEMTLTGEPPAHSQSLLSYATSGSNNELLLWYSSASDTLSVYINGASINTGIPSSSFLTTEPHQISVSWDSATGALEVYVDGVPEFSGTHQAGNPIASGGTLNFGQEQDTVGGSFDANQIFEGVINEVRIFDDVRTPAEIEAAANHLLSDPTTEPGLVANWQMDDVSTTSITDASGNGNDLTLNGGAEVIELTDGTGNDTIYGGDGDDEIHGLSGDDHLHGDDGNDTIYGDDGSDTIYGGEGDDTIEGGDGDDIIYGDGEAGLSLNDGATNQYAQVENYDDMPTDELTIEITMTGMPSDHSQALLSYAVEDPDNSHNEILLWDSQNTGTFQVHLNNSVIDTNIDTSTFLDGTPHQLSMSWNSATGALEVYVDGVSQFSGVFEEGNPITSGGSLIFGQDQDSLGGSFSSAQIFEGIVNEVRIFNDIRTPDEISDNTGHLLENPTTEPGLVSNWQMTPVGVSPIPDATGNDNDMVLYNGADVVDLADPAGDDTINGGAGDDEIYGGGGDDTISGDEGDDTISGGDGDDTITGGTGADTMSGGDGRDTFYVTAAESNGDSVDGGSGGDDLDTLVLGTESHRIVNETTDADGNSTSGTVEYLDAGGNVISTLTFTEIENIICFATGTRIATQRGNIPVEQLIAGDLVVTKDNGLQPLRWCGNRTVRGTGKFAPIQFKAGTFDNTRDLFVSPQHRMLMSGANASLYFGETQVLASAKHLVNGNNILRAKCDLITWHHLLFDRHEIIYAEGCPSESYHPGAQGLNGIDDGQREELFALFPQLRSNPNGYGMSARLCLRSHETRLLAA